MVTKENQRAAIRKLKRALGACSASGVQLFGMDNTLHATVSHDPSKDFHENYQEASGGDSERMEEVVTGGVYIGSGGW
jgi:hypothetical protein